MVHRPGDPQLLAQLIKHDKEYATAFHALVVASTASRDSLSAYAAASPQNVARPIAVIVSALTGADDALNAYRESFEEWREHLRRLKEIEDEVAVVLRDRQILINRVIKVSKAPRTASVSAPGPSSPSSSGIFSSTSSAQAHDAKVGQAQAELRACEAFLVDKEREHEGAWSRTMYDGLRARAKALADMGYHCAERGREALRALDGIAAQPTPMPPPPPPLNSFFKPLPDPGQSPSFNGHGLPLQPGPGSDHSSLTPSQSASQLDHGGSLSRSSSLSQRTSDGLPSSQPHPFFSPPSRTIVEEPEQAGSSSEEESPVNLKIVENNPRQSALSLRSSTSTVIANGRSSAPTHASSLRKPSRSRTHDVGAANGNGNAVPFPVPSSSRVPRKPSWSSGGSGEGGSARRRATSFSFFGSISSMFGGGRGKQAQQDLSSSPWSSRTEARLRRRKDSSSDDERANWQSDGGAPMSVSRSGSMRSTRSRKLSLGSGSTEEPSKVYIRASKPSAGGFTFTRVPSVSKGSKAKAKTGESPRSSSDLGPAGHRRASTDASLRRNVLENPRGPSLMSIVEGASPSVSRSSTIRAAAPSTRRESVQVVAASPHQTQTQHQHVQAAPVLRSPAPIREPQPTPAMHEPVTREAEARMGPLRSALRHGNGNGSSSPASFEQQLPATTRSYAHVPVQSSPLRAAVALPAASTSLPEAPHVGETTDDDSDADSYETGHETLMGDEPDSPPPPARPASPPFPTWAAPSVLPQASPPPPPPPTKSPPPILREQMMAPAASSSSTVSGHGPLIGTVSSAGTARRKSVRMVLPPDFAGTPLTTPTAERYNIQSHSQSSPTSASNGWTSRTSLTTATADPWQDSSDEDGDYQRARLALARADKHLSKAGGPEDGAKTSKAKQKTRKG